MPGAFFTPEPKERSNGSFVVNTLLSETLRSLMSAARSLADGLPPITRRTGCWRLRLRSIFSMLARKSASYPCRSSSMNTSALRVTCNRTASRTSCFLKSCGTKWRTSSAVSITFCRPSSSTTRHGGSRSSETRPSRKSSPLPIVAATYISRLAMNGNGCPPSTTRGERSGRSSEKYFFATTSSGFVIL